MKQLILAAIGATFGGIVSCGAEEEITNLDDCRDVCKRYSECVTDIDVTSCTEQCSDKADADEVVEDQADACAACVDDKACAEAEPCWDDCPVVPVQD